MPELPDYIPREELERRLHAEQEKYNATQKLTVKQEKAVLKAYEAVMDKNAVLETYSSDYIRIFTALEEAARSMNNDFERLGQELVKISNTIAAIDKELKATQIDEEDGEYIWTQPLSEEEYFREVRGE